MAKTTFDITTLQAEAQKSAQRAFHAGVGVTDLAVEVVRDYAAEAQKRFATAQKKVQKSVTDFDPKSLRVQATKDAKARRTAIEKRVAGLRTEAGTVPARVQKAFDANVTTASATYGDLVKRGESLVGRIRRQQSTQDTVAAAETTVAKAKSTRTQASAASTATKKTAAKKRTAARSSAKATRTSAKKTVSAGSRALADAAKKVGD